MDIRQILVKVSAQRQALQAARKMHQCQALLKV